MSTAGTIYQQEIQLGMAKLLSTQVVVSTVARVIFTSSVFDPAFDTFLFRYIDVATDSPGQYLYMSGAVNGAGTPDGTLFELGLVFTMSHVGAGGDFSAGTTSTAFSLSTILAAGPMAGGEVWWNKSNYGKQFTYHTSCYASATYGQVCYFGSANPKNAITSVWFTMGSGNLIGGTFRCYGFRKGA